MSDLINRQLAIDALLGLHTEHRVFWKDAVLDIIIALPSAQSEPCEFCRYHGLEDGDTLYISADWDGGIVFDYVRDIHYCPKCGGKLE